MPSARALAVTGVGALWFVLAANSASDAVGSVDPAALLRSSLDAPKNVSYVGQFESVRFSASRAIATIVKVEHRSPDLTRRWYVAPEALYGDYTIQRGTSMYEFDTKHARMTVTHNALLDDQVAAAGNFDRVLENYRAVVEGPDTVADRATTSIELVNKYTGERGVRVWLDRDTHLVLKKEEYHANGSVAAQSRFEDVRYTASIPESVFASTLPAGFTAVNGPDVGAPVSDVAHVIGEAGFTVIEPKELPQGFTLINGDVKTVGDVRTLHLVYGDGLRSISLFENATGAAANFGTLRPKTISFEGHDAQYVEDGPTTLLTWKEHGLYFALVGDLLRPELVAIAKSVIP